MLFYKPIVFVHQVPQFLQLNYEVKMDLFTSGFSHIDDRSETVRSITKSDDLAKNRIHDWRHIGYFWVFESCCYTEGNMWIPAALHIFKRVIEYVCRTPASIAIKKLVFPADWTHVRDKILDLPQFHSERLFNKSQEKIFESANFWTNAMYKLD